MREKKRERKREVRKRDGVSERMSKEIKVNRAEKWKKWKRRK